MEAIGNCSFGGLREIEAGSRSLVEERKSEAVEERIGQEQLEAIRTEVERTVAEELVGSHMDSTAS